MRFNVIYDGIDKCWYVCSDCACYFLTTIGTVIKTCESTNQNSYFATKALAQEALTLYYSQMNKTIMTNVTLTDNQLYTEMASRSSIEVGDTVKILRSFKDKEMGFAFNYAKGDYCKKAMDVMVGHTYPVTEIRSGGVYVIGDYYWPFFCLELISKKPKTITIQLNESYSAGITKDTVTVGCQTFPSSIIMELYKAYQALNSL